MFSCNCCCCRLCCGWPDRSRRRAGNRRDVVVQPDFWDCAGFLLVDPGMAAISDEKLQGCCIGSVSRWVKYFADDAVAAGEPDIAGGILRRSQDGIVRWSPGRVRPPVVVWSCAANRVNGVRLEEAR